MSKAALLVGLFLICAIIHADSISVDVSFHPSEASFTTSGSYDRITLPDTESYFAAGSPVVPFRTVRIALPTGMGVANVRYELGMPIAIPGQWHLEPTPDRAIVSGPKQITNPPRLDPRLTRGNMPYPATPVIYTGTGCASGYHIATVAVYPVDYVPATGSIRIYPSVRVIVDLTPMADPEPVRYRSPESEETVRDSIVGMVDNPEDVPESAVNGGANGTIRTMSMNPVDYLVITTSALTASLQPLVDWKNRKGVRTEMITMSTIQANYTGVDDCEKVRNCIKDYYTNHGTIYVLLGGDSHIVPMRAAYVGPDSNGNDIPCDLYYSDINGSWNADGDSDYGEVPNDVVDMFADVFVGRAPINNATDGNNFVYKVREYEADPTMTYPMPLTYQTRILMLANMLDDSTDTSTMMEAICTDSIPASWTTTKLYTSSGNLSHDSCVNELRSGYNLVCHNGHGGEGGLQMGTGGLDQSDILQKIKSSPRYEIFYSIGCYTCNVPYEESFGEVWATAFPAGGYYVGNSHYGWYYIGYALDGLSSRYCRYFYRSIFNLHNTRAGTAHARAKDLGVALAKTDGGERYCHYELNLMGDPETPIWMATPTALSVSHPTLIGYGSQVVNVTVHDSSGAPIPGARVCLSKDSQIVGILTTRSSGTASFTVNYPTACTLKVGVTKTDMLPYVGTIAVQNIITATVPTGWINAGWNWISVPVRPLDPSPASMFGAANVNNRLYWWDPVGHTVLTFPSDFSTIECGKGYTLLADGNVAGSVTGYVNESAFSIAIPEAGWFWLGHPFTSPVDLSLCTVTKAGATGERTAAVDAIAADPWLNWNVVYWDSAVDSAKLLTLPGHGGDDTMLRPWYGYRVWSNIAGVTLKIPTP